MPWHLLGIAIIPSIVAIAVLYRKRAPLQGNVWLLGLTVAFSVFQGLPSVQQIYAQVGGGEAPYFAYGLPLFVVLYLGLGRFEFPSPSVAWAGTFLGLVVTDLAFSIFQWRLGALDIGTLLRGIGGVGVLDGLVILPIGSALLTAFVRHRLNAGEEFTFMLGRKT